MAKTDLLCYQPIEGAPIVKVGNRFLPLEAPSDKGKSSDNVFWFIYSGSKKAKLTIDVENWTETLEEVE